MSMLYMYMYVHLIECLIVLFQAFLPRSQFDFSAKGLYGPSALLFESLSKEQ